MNQSFRWTVHVALALAVASSVGTMAVGKEKNDSPGTIAVSEVTAGMKGHGLTVFEGLEPEKFDVEVISVIHDFLPNQDLILARCSHPVLDHAGVIAGMSGSPVFLDGRLAGAVAYAWRFAKDPIAGITPVASMKAYLDMPAMPPGLGTGIGKLVKPSQADVTKAPPSFWDRFDMQTSQVVPLATPVSGSGVLWSSFVQTLGPMLASNFMVEAPPVPAASAATGVVSAGKGKGTDTGSSPFRPGDAIAVRLVGGDLDMAATGTVTFVQGTRALGFGHPMFNFGEVRFPAARAHIHHCLASEAFSFKMSESLEAAGTIVQDRQAGILSDASVDPQTVDLEVRLEDGTRGMKQTWHMDVAHHPSVTPSLVRSALTSAVDHFALEVVDTVVEGSFVIEVAGHEELKFDDKVFLSTGTLSLAYSQRLAEALSVIMQSPFEKARVERVIVDLELTYGHDVATIAGAWAEKDEVEEGDQIRVWVVIAPHQGSKMTLPFTLDVPAGTAGQKIRVEIKPGSMVPPEYVPPDDLDDVIANLALGWPDDKAVALVQAPSMGLIIEGKPIPTLPLSALSTLKPEAGDLGEAPLVTMDRYFITTPYLLEGSVFLSISVKQK